MVTLKFPLMILSILTILMISLICILLKIPADKSFYLFLKQNQLILMIDKYNENLL